MTDTAKLTALAGAAVSWDASSRARVRLVGKDARSFLHRITTNDVGALPAGAGRLNVFATDKGRFVDIVHHLQVGDEDVLLIGSAGTGPALLAWIDKYLFTEKVELKDETGGRVAEVAGAGAADVVERLVPGAGALPPWGFAAAGARVVVRTFPRVDAAGRAVPCFLVVDDGTAALDVPVVDAATADVLRVAGGVPGIGREIAERFNPLDVELHDAVSWTKGCYTGQEVIARLDTYQKQSRRLMALHTDDAAPLQPGDAILVDGAPAGEVTSVAPAAWGDRPRALGMVRSNEQKDELPVQVKRADGTLIAATARKRTAAQEPHD